MTQPTCKARNPETCRYHAQPNILHKLREEARQAAETGDAEKYLKLKEKADIIESIYAESEQRNIEERERYLKVNGLTNENETTTSIRADREAQYIVERAFQDYHASTYEEKKEMLQTELVLTGGKTETVALFNLDGEMLPAKLLPVANRYTGEKEYIWGILKDNDPKSEVKEWFRPSKAKKEETANRNNASKGYYVGKVWTPAYIKKATHSTLTGSYSWPEIAPRWDTPFDSPEITVIDNGKQETETP